MLTTKEFKAIYNISDSSFTRLVKRLKSEHPDLTLTTRTDSKTWVINHPDLFEKAVKKEVSEMIPVPSSKISVFTETQNDQLTILSSQTRDNSFNREITLNGGLNTALSTLQMLANEVEKLSAENIEIETALETRELTADSLKTIAFNLGKKFNTEQTKREELELKASELQKSEKSLKKQLDFLSQYLQ